MAARDDRPFRPALVVVDFQEDFCPPHGSLAVSGGRDIASAVNELVNLPFACKIATQDWHPANHVSFASNHAAPDNKPFESVIAVKNPLNEAESESVRLWPDHCIQRTFGAQLVPEFEASKIDVIVRKGQDHRVEMFSAFRDTYSKPCVSQSDLASVLSDRKISHVYVCGLAADFCVKYTALHAALDGFRTFVVSEATRAVDQNPDSLQLMWNDLDSHGVSKVELSGSEVARVKQQKHGV